MRARVTEVSGGVDEGPVALLWTRDEEEIARRVCARAGTVVTAQEWAKLVPGLPYAPPCR